MVLNSNDSLFLARCGDGFDIGLWSQLQDYLHLEFFQVVTLTFFLFSTKFDGEIVVYTLENEPGAMMDKTWAVPYLAKSQPHHLLSLVQVFDTSRFKKSHGRPIRQHKKEWALSYIAFPLGLIISGDRQEFLESLN